MICSSEDSSSDNGDVDLSKTVKTGGATRSSLPSEQTDLLDMENAMD